MYKIVDGQIIRISDGAIVPSNDPDYLEWIATSSPEPLGNVPPRIRDMTEAEILRRQNAKAEAALSTQLRTATPQQAEAYVVQQITNGIPETTALANFDAANSLATIKPILRNMLVGMYRTVDVLKLIVRVLVSMRDHLWPDL